ncbi:DUF1565 domain-containing protein [Spirillospora sp. CA-253888]
MKLRTSRVLLAAATAATGVALLGGAPAAQADAAPPIAIVPTDYPVPAGAVFVSPAGDDAAAGDQAHPLKTVAKAVSKTAAGGTIVIRQGTYRETLGGIHKRLTIQPYPHEQVWFKGSSVISPASFVADGTAWRLDGWNPGICQPESGTPPKADLLNCVHPDGLSSENRIGGDPEMVFVDGAPLAQVATRAEVGSGEFYWDSVAGKLYLGTAPGGRTIEVSDRKLALQFHSGAAGSVVRGLGFTQYATAPTRRRARPRSSPRPRTRSSRRTRSR